MRTHAIVCCAILAAGCAADRGTGADPARRDPPLFSYPPNASCNSASPQFPDKYWTAPNGVNMFPCGATVRVIDNAGLPTGVVNNAIGIWNTGVLGAHELPRLDASTGTGPMITIVTDGSGPYACGETFFTSSRIAIHRSTATNNCGGSSVFRVVDYANTTQLTRLVAHELGHTLGFGHFVVGLPVYSNQHVRYCMMVVPPNYPDALNGSVCEHERQIIYYQYRLQGADPSIDKDFAMGLNLTPSNLALDLGASGGIAVQSISVKTQDNPELEVAPGVGDVFAWSGQNVTPPGSWTIDAASGPGTSVHAGSAVGTAQAQADLIATDPYNIGWPFRYGAASLSIQGPTAAPSALTVGSVTPSSAALGWTNGDANATTTVQHRASGVPGWTTDTTVPTGAATYPLTGLGTCTTYDVQLYHTRNTINSPMYQVSSAFRTPAAGGACAPSNFHITQCVATVIRTVTYRTYYLGWTQGEFSAGSAYELGQTNTSDTTGATVLQGGAASVTSDSLGPYAQKQYSPTVYWWIRHKLADGTPSVWVALGDGPIRLGWPC